MILFKVNLEVTFNGMPKYNCKVNTYKLFIGYCTTFYNYDLSCNLNAQ